MDKQDFHFIENLLKMVFYLHFFIRQDNMQEIFKS